jgi:hypothetical protein
MSPTNLSREIWRKDAWSAQNIYDSYQYAQHPGLHVLPNRSNPF